MLYNCVIYHMNCHDGFASAAIYYKYLKENYPEKLSECQFIPAAYNGKPPNIKDKDVLMAGNKIKINKKSNTYFIGTENFVAITKYNYSHFYAMVVYNLARELGL